MLPQGKNSLNKISGISYRTLKSIQEKYQTSFPKAAIQFHHCITETSLWARSIPRAVSVCVIIAQI